MENTNESNNVCKATAPTGVELIARERYEQINKHGKSLIMDKTNFQSKELKQAALSLITNDHININNEVLRKSLKKAIDKSYKDRLIIAGALIAAEIDRIS